ncbi:hypothetical protein [Paraburkholderia fungorum]|uniref:hypothetical protein n=1 Tax=Paraburkholderia fungorum TaxID=134537 RepID=UPI0020975625|nr:hypothetical protein [Paraburkholderia fungorum]USX08239.1 hypothetical protein NHH62_37425 [Paraburkholderia fungorum]
MKRVFASICVCTALIAHAATAAPTTGIYPESLQGTASFELGSVILALMPSPNQQQIGWDWQADSPIQWQNGYTLNPGATRSYRNGVLRINVMGDVSTVLRQRTDELGWTVTLYTDAPPKFGPDSISFEPGLTGRDACFGTLYDGCDFNPLPSLQHAKINARLLCQFDESGRPNPSNANFTRTYRVSAEGKAPTLMQWQRSSGSGGSTSTVTLLLKATPAQACKPDSP